MSKIDFTKMTSDQLMAFWETHHQAHKLSRQNVCGQLGKGTVLATKAAANYACNLAVAMQLREEGANDRAEIYERICADIKPRLPQTIIA